MARDLLIRSGSYHPRVRVIHPRGQDDGLLGRCLTRKVLHAGLDSRAALRQACRLLQLLICREGCLGRLLRRRA